MTETRLDAALVVTGEGPVAGGSILVDDGVIVSIEAVDHPVPDRILAPGLVDLQVNGVGDVDCWTADGHDWAALDATLLAQGVTAWCPTLVSASLDRYGPALERIAAASTTTTILGAHLEGPFLGGRPGAHRPDRVIDLDLDWLRALPETVRLVTLAPEQPDAVEAVAALVEKGITVSLGHSSADAAAVGAAVDAGATLVTHLFNGMDPMHHRRPGLVGTALADDRLTAMVIADLVHVHPVALRLATRAKGTGRWIAVTDSVAWSNQRLGEEHITFDGAAPRRPDGTLAGSALRMDAAVGNLVRHCGVSPSDAVVAASTTPARAVATVDRGVLRPGARADIVALDLDTLSCEATWVAGRQVHPPI